ncbi:hypothetical protein REMIM1_PE00564 (plasmid) [Rhizobium etli bv. mimosae str. Mim1]|nr:hypothetical protein REMIM1_PE00564 [Rhizobium etli bv. mimosae str. Mim1]
MRWSLHGAHMLMEVRAAELDGELRNRLRIPIHRKWGCKPNSIMQPIVLRKRLFY